MEHKQDKLRELLPDCKMTRWHEHAFDIINAAGGKEKGIEKVLEYYKIDRQDVMAFGDGDNDVSMFNYVGLSVCLSNGSKLALEAADYISSDIDDDGIYNALKHFNII
jgi:hydroxymethylpyrimidine pyrophosphatase-like HAD family hydrolase